MGDNALSILIQAEIDKNSTATIENELKNLQNNLKSIKISLDLGDIKNQFANLFKDLAREAERQQINATGSRKANAGKEMFGDYESAIEGVKKLDAQYNSMIEKVKELGDIKSIKEVFSSSTNDVKQLSIELETIENGLKQLKTIDIFKNVTKTEDGELIDVYQLSDLRVKTQEVKEEAEEISSSMQDTNNALQQTISFTGTQEEAMRKVVLHASALSDNLQNVREVVKDFGELADLKEQFSSADGSLLKMQAKVEEVDGTLRQIKNIEVFRTLNESTGEYEYTLGKINVQTREFGYTLDQLKSAGKTDTYKRLYDSMVKFLDGGEDAIVMAKELQNAIYFKNGNEKPFFAKLDEGIRNEYLKALQQAKEEEQKALDEAYKMNAKFDEERAKAQKEAQIKAMKQANIDLFKNGMNQNIEALEFAYKVDDTQLQVLKDALQALDVETENVSTVMKQLRADFNSLKDGSVQITTATSSMSALEQEIVGVGEKLKTQEITLEQYADKMKDLIFNDDGSQTDAFKDNVDIQDRIKYLNEYNKAIEKITAQEARLVAEEQKREKKQANIDLFKNSMNQSLDALTSTHNVDGQQVQAIRDALEALSAESDDVSISIRQINADFQDLKDSSTQITTATSNMSLLEREIVSVNEQLKTQKIDINEYAEQMKNLMFDSNGNQTSAFENNIDIQNRIKYLNEYTKAIQKIAKEEEQLEAKRVAQAKKQAEVDSFKEKMNKDVDELLFNSYVDTNRLDAFLNAMEQLDANTDNVSQRMRELKEEFQGIVETSTRFTTATSTMSLLEQEIVRVSESLKDGRISAEQYVEEMNNLMHDADGNQTNAFISNVDIQDRIRYTNEYNRVVQEIERTKAQELAREQQERELLQEKATLYRQIEEQLRKIEEIKDDSVRHDEDEYNGLVSSYNALREAVENGSMSMKEARSRMQELSMDLGDFERNTREASSAWNEFKQKIIDVIGIASIYDIFEMGKEAISNMISEITELDSAFGELNKVADLSKEELEAFSSTAFKVGEAVGRMGSDVIRATTDFVQMGYSVQEASKLAENALMYVNVGDLGSVDDATGTMISTMKAFGIEAESSLQIVDKINNISNHYAISAEGIGSGLQKASSALSSANNDINETLALMAVGNQVVQDPDSLANGLRTISMRLRGLSEDGGELESKMEDVFATYANGVKILNDDGTFKSTFEILRDLGKEWDNLSDKTQALLAEKVAGKNRANIFLALMQNAEDLNEALITAQNSAGSAMEENAHYMDGIESKISQLQTAWQSLAHATIDSELVKTIIDAGTAMIKFTEACGGLIPVVIGLGTALALLKFTSLGGIIADVTLKIMTMIPVLTNATGAVMALNGALSFGIGGLIVGGIMAVGAGIKYLATESERAEEKINNLKSTITDLTTEKANVEELARTYEALSNKAELSEEEQAQLVSTMSKLKELVPNLNGYYKENGEFVVTSTDAIKEYIEAKKEEIALNREAVAESAKEKNEDLEFEIDKQKKLIKGAENYLELIEKQNTTGLSSEEASQLANLSKSYTNVSEAQKRVESSTKIIADSLVDYRTNLIDVLSATDDWNMLSEEQRDVMREIIAEGDYSFLQTIFNDAVNGTQNFIDKLLELGDAQDILNAKSTQTKKTLKDFGIVVQDVESLKKAFQSITDGLGDLNSVLDDLNNGNGITAKSLDKIMDRYPELLQYINDENTLRTQIQSTMDEQKNKQQDIYNQMLSATDSYYQNVMLKNEDWKNKTQANVEQLFRDLKVEYDGSITDYANMEQAKAGITEQLINKLGNAWSGYFNQMSKAMSGGSTFEEWVSTQGDWNTMSIAKIQALEEEWKKLQAVREGVNSLFDDFQFTPITLEIGGSTKKEPTSSSSSSSSKKNPKASYIASIYQEIVDEILKGGEEIEKAMEMVEAKLENAQLTGNKALENTLREELLTLQTSLRDKQATMAKELEKQMAEMAKILSNTGIFKNYDLANLSEKDLAEVLQNIDKQINTAKLASNDKEQERLEALKSLISDVGGVYIDTIEERRELSKIWWDEENQRIEVIAEQINEAYNLQKQKIDEANRDIELQQLLLKEGTEEYIEWEKKKYQNILAEQEEASKALQKIKEHDKNLESKLAKDYLNLWYDAEKKKREMIKSINQQIMELRKEELEKQIEAMEEYKDSMEDIIEATIKLIKQEQNEKKKALKEELDGYKKIIDAKKEVLQKDKDDKDYQKELSEKQAEITKVENKILELQNDNSLSAKKKRQELEEELMKLKEELNEMQEEKGLENALEALDKEYEAFEETQNEKIDAIDDYLDKEGQLRQDAIKRIENDQQNLYKQLLEWNKKYGTAVDSDITNAWNKAMEGMKNYGEGQNKVLETIENIVEKLKEANDEIKYMQENSGVISAEDMVNGQLQDSPTSNSTVKPTGDAYQKLIDEVAPQMNRNSDAWFDASPEERKRLEQENERLAKQIGAYKRNGEWVVMSNHKVVRLKDLYPNYHTGGIVGGAHEAKLKTTEQFATLLKGENVSTELQMKKFMERTYPSMLGMVQNRTSNGINIDRFVDITVQGNLDSTLDLENIIKRASQKAIDTLVNTMSNMGIRGRVI